MASLHGYAAAVYDALPEKPPGLPTRGVIEILALRCVRPPATDTVRRHLRRLLRAGVVRTHRDFGPPLRYWRAE